VSGSGLLASIGLSTVERRDLLTDEPGPAGIAPGVGRVFYANDIADAAELRQYDLLSGRASSIASGRSSVHALVADAAAVYWTEPSAGKVMKVSLTP